MNQTSAALILAFIALASALSHSGRSANYEVVYTSYHKSCDDSEAFSIVVTEPDMQCTPQDCTAIGNTGLYSHSKCLSGITLPKAEDGWVRVQNYSTPDCRDIYNPVSTLYIKMFACAPDWNNVSHFYVCNHQGDTVFDYNCGATFHCGGACKDGGKILTQQCVNGQVTTCMFNKNQ